VGERGDEGEKKEKRRRGRGGKCSGKRRLLFGHFEDPDSADELFPKA